ncbi:MAG TPA: hypothetical protein VN539_00885, partial [Candidatus Saccharimonadales bacterium]|nr:hypothetical protein [Candidatus Saccharimonadales bacterium]
HWAPVRALRPPTLGRRRAPEPALHALLGHTSIPIVLEGYGSRNRQEVSTALEYTFEQTVYEVGIGLAGIWNIGPIRTHFGGGIATVTNQWKPVEGSGGASSSMTRSGPFISAGAFLPLVSGFNLGAVGRYTDVDADYGQKLGGWSANALLGWGWHR